MMVTKFKRRQTTLKGFNGDFQEDSVSSRQCAATAAAWQSPSEGETKVVGLC